MKLIADSGSTKTDWCLCDGKHVVLKKQTEGMNPVHQDDSTILKILDDVAREIDESSLDIRFYGAGCIPEQTERMTGLLKKVFSLSSNGVSENDWTPLTVAVYSDLMASCHAFCGHQEGIACILGTGSNSCLYNGECVVACTPAMGYILGDEGSGAVLGKNFLNALFKGMLSPALKAEFLNAMSLTYADIIECVYRMPMPNRFLATLSPFIHRHLNDDSVRNLVVDNFRAFFQKNIAPYRRSDLPVNVVGGMAYHFREELEEAAHIEGFCMGHVEKSPMPKLIEFWNRS